MVCGVCGVCGGLVGVVGVVCEVCLWCVRSVWRVVVGEGLESDVSSSQTDERSSGLNIQGLRNRVWGSRWGFRF